MRRSGITSRWKWASFSSSQTSCNRAGPRDPAVWMLKLSVTGVPDAWDSGGRLGWAFIDGPPWAVVWVVLTVGWRARGLVGGRPAREGCVHSPLQGFCAISVVLRGFLQTSANRE